MLRSEWGPIIIMIIIVLLIIIIIILIIIKIFVVALAWWCEQPVTGGLVFPHHSSRWLYVLHRVGTHWSQGFILVHEHIVILWRLPDVLLSIPHKHHLLSTGWELMFVAEILCKHTPHCAFMKIIIKKRMWHSKHTVEQSSLKVLWTDFRRFREDFPWKVEPVCAGWLNFNMLHHPHENLWRTAWQAHCVHM